VLEPDEAKVSRPVLRGLGGRKTARPLDPIASFQRNRVNPHRFSQEESASQDAPIAVRITDEGESECHSVMERISVASATSTTSPDVKAG
jgi:hypothetical protein